MAKQWQIRRGTTAENNDFTGAIGEVTMDTTTKGLRVHDGSTQGGFMIDTVVAYQLPTAENNYTWYRKYASGCVEQGGIWTGSWVVGNGSTGTQSITIPVEMADTNYYINVDLSNGISTSGDQIWTFHATQGLTTTNFSVVAGGYNNSRTITRFVWQIKGMAA